MARPPLLSLQNIGLILGGKELLQQAELFIFERDRVCLVGRNGSGKSTLLKVAAGLIEPDAGERFVKPGVTVRYMEQEPDFSGHNSVMEFVLAGLGPADDPHRATLALADLGLSGEEDPSRLSGGEARRAAIARALAPDPDILLLDEPTNHMDLPAVEWMENAFAQARAAIVLISHDRAFLNTLTKRVVWLERGHTRAMDRGFAHFEDWRDQIFEEEERDAHKLDRKIVREEHWVVHGVSGRRKRNVRRLAELESLRARRRETVRPQGTAKAAVLDGRESGKLVIEAKDVAKAYGERAIVSAFSTKILRGDRVGLAGPNGAGKTTLVKLITGQLEPDAGTVRLGTKLDIVALDQQRAQLDPHATVKDALTGGRGDQVMVGDTPRHVIGYMKDFLFGPEKARAPVAKLSGGERGRLALAIALARPSNLLILDEPTNDLDLETLDLLEEILADYAGTVLLVSHDRDFLDRVVTSTITLDPEGGPGAWREYAGGYTDMVRQRGGAATAKTPDAVKPGPSKAKSPDPASSKAKSAKLSYKDKYALETLPGRIETLTGEIETHKATLADPELFAADPDLFSKTADALAALEAELAQAEETWLEAAMRAEELG